MRTNPERRTALLDAVIDVLAAHGSRGLTFRAVDARAGLPTGTASNYFADRDQMLTQAGAHLFVRLTPDPDEVAARLAGARDRALETQMMHDIVRRATADRAGHLAMIELRLEATRRPEIADELTSHYRANLAGIVESHVGGGFPGDQDTAVLLYLAMTGLLLEVLTLPGVLDIAGGVDDLVERVVAAIVPDG